MEESGAEKHTTNNQMELKAMIEGLKKNKFKTDLPKHEMVYWADILYDKPLNQFEKDKESPYYLDEIYAKPSKDAVDPGSKKTGAAVS